MNAKLLVVKGAKKATIRLRLPTIIGRSSAAAVKVPSSLVSRQHCEIAVSGGELVVRDLGSANGTFVNDERIDAPTLLFEEDLLRVGPVLMRISPEQAAEQSPVNSRPAAHEEAVAEREPRGSTAASSILNYRETDEGSFIGIEDFDDEEEDAGAAAPDKLAAGQSAVDALGGLAGGKQPKTAGKSALHALDGVVEKDAAQVDGGDSALGNFFKNLG
jgi:hypothetical protein